MLAAFVVPTGAGEEPAPSEAFMQTPGHIYADLFHLRRRMMATVKTFTHPFWLKSSFCSTTLNDFSMTVFDDVADRICDPDRR